MNAYTSSSPFRALAAAPGRAGGWPTSAWGWSAASSCVIGGLGKNVARHRANRARRDSEPCLVHYRCRLLERSGIACRTAPDSELCAPGQRHAAPAEEKETQDHEDEERTDRPEAGDDVVDRGHEIVRGVVERGGESPAVGRSRPDGRPRLRHRHADRAERRVVVEVLDLALELFDLGRDLADLVLDRDDVVDVLRLRQQREHRVPLSFCVGQPRAEIDVLRADVGAGDVLALDLADLGQLIDRGVEMRGRDHEVDDARPDLAVLSLTAGARLGAGAPCRVEGRPGVWMGDEAPGGGGAIVPRCPGPRVSPWTPPRGRCCPPPGSRSPPGTKSAW